MGSMFSPRIVTGKHLLELKSGMFLMATNDLSNFVITYRQHVILRVVNDVIVPEYMMF